MVEIFGDDNGINNNTGTQSLSPINNSDFNGQNGGTSIDSSSDYEGKMQQSLGGDEEIIKLTRLINGNNNNNILSLDIKNLKFGYTSNQPINEGLISQLGKDAKGDNSIEGQLKQNEQVQLLLSDMLNEYSNYIKTDRESFQHLIQQEKKFLAEKGIKGQEEFSKIIDGLYQYRLDNDKEVGFENFVTSHGINSIKNYLQSHMSKDGMLPISPMEIKAKVRIDWLLKLYVGYYTENKEATKQFTNGLVNVVERFSYAKNCIDKEIHSFLSGNLDKNNLAKNLSEFFGGFDRFGGGTFLDNDVIRLVRLAIKEYARGINNSGNELGYTGYKMYDMQLRSYLYLYGLYAYNKNFKGDGLEGIKKFDPKKGLDDKELFGILNAILIADGNKQDDGTNNEYLSIENNVCKTHMENNVNTRLDVWGKMKAVAAKKPNKGPSLNQEKNKLNIDIQNATGVEIAQNRNLGREIKSEEFNKKKSLDISKNRLLKENILEKSGKDLIKNEQGVLSKYLDVKRIKEFFKLQDNVVIFKYDEWENFEKERIEQHPQSNRNELYDVKNRLLKLPNIFEENLNKAGIFIDKKGERTHETVKNYALGAVIDVIKDMFQNIVETNSTGKFMSGFEFNEDNGARIKGDCLFLSGTFNGESMIIKYDLKEGKLYMNSFINITDKRITITGSDEPISEIGKLDSFDKILDKFYKSPTEYVKNNIFSQSSVNENSYNSVKTEYKSGGNQQEPNPRLSPHVHKMNEFRDKIRNESKKIFGEMCGIELDKVSDKIKDKVESKSIREPVALNLLRTLGIMPKDDGTKNFNKGSDLYEITQLITSSNNNVVDINKFSEYMETFMDNIGLSRGENNSHQDKTGDIAKIIFDENNKQDNIKYVRENAKSFDNEYSVASENAQFDEESNFGILKIIKEKFTDNKDKYPNRKLSASNIETFKNELKEEILEVQGLASLEIDLDNAYSKN